MEEKIIADCGLRIADFFEGFFIDSYSTWIESEI